MTGRPTAWWRGLSGVAKFRVYTRMTVQLTVVGVLVALAGSVATPWAAVVGLAVAGLAGVAVVEVQPALAEWPGDRLRRAVLVGGVGTLAVVWAAYALVANLAEDRPLVDAARVAGLFTVLVLAVAVLPFFARRWEWLLAASVATGLAFGSNWPSRLVVAGVLLLCGGFIVASMLLTLSGLRLVTDLERTRGLEARLRVADERLRFSRDLHDVVGRGFSAVAVKSELAATLARAGAADRAAAEMEEVRVLAVESMGQMRELVRGYRDIDLAGEVAGARSLLAAVGCRLDVQGDPTRLPERFHETAAWVTREGTTNIVRHAAATSAVLAFGDSGMSLRNDGVRGAMGERSGLRGLAERVAQAGAGLRTSRTGEEFLLEVVWGTP